MDRALGLAERGWGNVAPNPLVGAVLVRDGAVLSEGWHASHGGPHAEIAALSATGDASGATLYVTLEPCAHHGLTPPCTDAILRAGIVRLVFAAADPNPVAAGGAEVLRARGIAVTAGVMAERARRLNAAFFHAHETGTCWVALKLALSLDGAIAAAPGIRTQLTGPGAHTETHRLRSGFDAVLVGIGTASIDDPLLTTRTPTPPRLPVARVVFDAEASLSPDSRLVRTAAESPVHVVC
jgi:diaminohydroxyphosphoribosylaminopyrimidine deaminase/5-amino-6-(5-phosphoribosylamino)uracil reductase